MSDEAEEKQCYAHANNVQKKKLVEFMDANREFLNSSYRNGLGKAKWLHFVSILNSLGKKTGNADTWWKTWNYLKRTAREAFKKDTYEKNMPLIVTVAKIINLIPPEDLDKEDQEVNALNKENVHTISLDDIDSLPLDYSSELTINDDNGCTTANIDSIIASRNSSPLKTMEQQIIGNVATASNCSKKSILLPSSPSKNNIQPPKINAINSGFASKPLFASSHSRNLKLFNLKSQEHRSSANTKPLLLNAEENELVKSGNESQKVKVIAEDNGQVRVGQLDKNKSIFRKENESVIEILLRKLTVQLEDVLDNLKSINANCQNGFGNLENQLQNLHVDELSNGVHKIAAAESQTSLALTSVLSQLATQFAQAKI